MNKKIDIGYYWERAYPLLFSVAATVLIYRFRDFINQFDTLVVEIAKNSLTICGTLLGFFLTILTIINSIPSRRMEFVKSTGNYPRLMDYLKTSIQYNLVVIVASFAIIFLDVNKVDRAALNIIHYVFIFITSLALTTSIRFTTIFISLLIDKKEQKVQQA